MLTHYLGPESDHSLSRGEKKQNPADATNSILSFVPEIKQQVRDTTSKPLFSLSFLVCAQPLSLCVCVWVEKLLCRQPLHFPKEESY